MIHDKIKKLILEAKEKIKAYINPKDNNYPDVGKGAPTGVKQAIEEFRKLSDDKRAETPLWAWLMPDGIWNYKTARRNAQYTDISKKRNSSCGNCEFFYQKMSNKEKICTNIPGKVKDGGWCRYWEKATK